MEETTKTTENFHHLNKVNLKGIVRNIVSGTTSSGTSYLNVLLEIRGKKYTDIIPCVVYGELSKAIASKVSVGDTIMAYGRLRSKMKQEQILISFVCEQFDVIK